MYYTTPIILFLLIITVTPSVASSSAKLFLVQQISLVQCLDNQTCTVVADGITERELEIVSPEIKNQSGNPFISDHVHRINN